MSNEVVTEEKQEVLCPSCDKAVRVGEVQCPHCGVNMRSGETFDTQVKRTRAAAEHRGHLAGTIMIAVAMLLACTLGGGYIHHSRTRTLWKSGPDPLAEPHRLTNFLTRLSMIAPLAKADDLKECRAILKANSKDIDGAENYVRIPAKGQSGGSDAKDVYAEIQATCEATESPKAYALKFAEILIADLKATDKALVPHDPTKGANVAKVTSEKREYAEVYSITHYKKSLRKMVIQIENQVATIEAQDSE